MKKTGIEKVDEVEDNSFENIVVNLTDNFRIVKNDPLNLTLQEFREVREVTRNGKTTEARKEWRWAGYYGDLYSAVLGAFSSALFSAEKETIGELKEYIEDNKRQIVNALNELKREAHSKPKKFKEERFELEEWI